VVLRPGRHRPPPVRHRRRQPLADRVAPSRLSPRRCGACQSLPARDPGAGEPVRRPPVLRVAPAA
jgi:hypothetical protein